MSRGDIQSCLLVLYVVYLVLSIAFKRFRNKNYRACLFIFIIAGLNLIVGVGDGISWVHFLAIFLPISVLYEIEHKLKK
ncbi:hypothetical protein [Streptococcus sp. NLN64]|uniref:hypothetical protein n=1 Tax=Streptococcus sp. NLN64 TaxID=2822799 RepID=UPI0018C9C0D8|nr:hypothetical protein [Streptococcus sp. NLN64]MBG9366692.1 hypothetical protein [Streptococcus sp. NLN64]